MKYSVLDTDTSEKSFDKAGYNIYFVLLMYCE